MIPMMVEELAATDTKESPDELFALARNFVMELNGKQTIYQMIRLAEEIRSRGGAPRDPLDYKQQYHDRLMERIANRRQSLENGTSRPEDLLVPGTYAALRTLQERGLELCLASGTDENYVREEATLLGLTPFFGSHIYGAIDDHRKFSKQMVIERILRENQVEGSRLIGLGDGYVEIDNIKGAGGTAIAVASDEAGRSGKPDPWKRDRLIGVGADLVIPDFREFQAVCDYLWRDFR
jgi:phosphoglycolate phosphatase-like HAD superfamily hydrolase